MVAFTRRGRHLTVVGGLLAPEELRGALLEDVMELARLNGLAISFFNIGEVDLFLFRRFSFQVTKLGEDASIPLIGQNWSGRHYEWVRRQSNYCQKKGLCFGEARRASFNESDWAEMIGEMIEVSQLHLLKKPQRKEMRVFVGQLHPDHLGRKRIFLSRAENGQGRIEGFVLCNPCLGGTHWALEMFRQRPDSVRGVIPFLMLHAMRQLASEGIEEVSLCLVPTLNLVPMPGDSRVFRGLMNTCHRFGNFLFNTNGLYYYKSRFRPRFQPRYVCAFPKITVGRLSRQSRTGAFST